MHGPSTPHRLAQAARATLVGLAMAGAGAASAQTTPLSVSFNPATGTLQVGNGAPGDKRVKIEVGPAAGQARVIDSAANGTLSFAGVRAIAVASGAGRDEIEFDINASQSLSLNVDSGSGDASLKIQWKLPPGAAHTDSLLTLVSGGGAVNVELDFESETASSTFGWTTQMGGGNKLIKGGIEFKPGTQVARKNVNFASLGGGAHSVLLEVDSEARDAVLNLDSGAAGDVGYKVLSSNPTTRLEVNTRVRGDKNAVEILSAAPTTVVSLSGGTPNAPVSETKYIVGQKVAGTLAARLDFAPLGSVAKFESKFEGLSGTLALGGSLRGGGGADFVKIETNLPVTGNFLLDAGGGDNIIDFITGAALRGSPRFVMGGGNDFFNLLAGPGSTGVPLIDCGAGNDTAKASVGTASGCESFSR